MLLRFWEGDDKKTAPTLYLRLTPTEMGFPTGQAFPDVQGWRSAVDAEGDALRAALDDLVAETDASVVGEELKRVPKPFDAEHPHGDLLRHKWLQARWPRPLPQSVGAADFADWCADELARARAIHGWLTRNLG